MFDDSQKNCHYLQNSGINCYLMETKYNVNNRENLKTVKDFKDIYNVVCKMEKERLPKVHVILDTDINNEADDQFALSYLLNSNDRVILDAVTLAPYSHSITKVEESQELNYNVAKDIFKLCDEEYDEKIYKGSKGYISNGYNETSPAVEKIIEIANRNELTYILAIGAITNIALAIKKCPDIVGKIKVIWLGGNSLICEDNREYNFYQDIEANRIVFYSKVDLTIVPVKNLSDGFITSIYELEYYFDVSKGLGKYLYDRFKNDGLHGLTKRRPIFDMVAASYLVNPYNFETTKVKCPLITDDLKYEESDFNHSINFVTSFKSHVVNEIFDDMVNKIGDRNENR